jgi:hypothetical protein
MTRPIPPHLTDLFTIADRAVTAALFEAAATVAAGSAADAIVAAPPPFVRALFPDLVDADRVRIAILVGWAQYTQHICSTREICRRWRIARTLGASDGDAIDDALAQGAEFCEQQFVAWACGAPLGAVANSTDRFMSALAERIAARVAAYQSSGSRS